MESAKIKLPSPALQVDFSRALAELRSECLQDALLRTVAGLDIADLNRELSEYVSPADLAALAGRGLRGELLFAVPALLRANPKLIGYYRLLLGFSQKVFYSSSFGTSSFKGMEDRGRLPSQNATRLPALCHALVSSASELLFGIGVEKVTRELLDDLTLLTLGPQMRGGANVRKGTEGIELVFKAIHSIVKKKAVAVQPRRIEVVNAAKRRVLIEFSADPDIVIREVMPGEALRNVIAIEIKGGTDFSNIHNRIGEAEKSHQKARRAGFVECWTVVNVDRFDREMALKESPSTNRFYRISAIVSREGEEYADFRARLVSLTGIPGR